MAELQSLLSEMEGRNKAQSANIESLTATLNTKDDIINVIILLMTLPTKHNGILNQKSDNLYLADIIIQVFLLYLHFCAGSSSAL